MCDNIICEHTNVTNVVIPFYNNNSNNDSSDNDSDNGSDNGSYGVNVCIICLNDTEQYFYHFEDPNYEKSNLLQENIKSLFYYNLKNQNCNCNYNIHFECLIYWLFNNQQCPICRNNIEMDNEINPLKIEQKYNKLLIVSNNRNDDQTIIIDLNACDYIENTLNISENNTTDNNINDIYNIENENDNGNIFVAIGEVNSIILAKTVGIVLFIFLFTTLILVYFMR